MNEKANQVPTARVHYVVVATISLVGMAIIYSATGEFSAERFDLAIAEMIGGSLMPTLIAWAGLRWWQSSSDAALRCRFSLHAFAAGI